MKMANKNIGWLLTLLWVMASCSKNEEPPKTVGQRIPYTQITNRSLVELIDSIPDLRIYDSIYHHSDLGHQLDSLRKAGAASMFTLFAPTDSAFQKAGISLAQVAGYAPAVLDSIVYYLALSGPYTSEGLGALQGYEPVNTLLQVTSIASSYQGEPWNPGNGYSQQYPYFYYLTLGFTNGSLMLNGEPVTSSGASVLQATDGVLWANDTLITKPTQEAYAVISADTAYSLYMAACSISDSIYVANYVSFSTVVYTSGPDTVSLQMMQGVAPRTYFIPTNNAFRKAGFFTYNDIDDYIQNSVVVISGNFYNQYYNVMTTNMDSILLYNQSTGVFYTQDMLQNPTLNVYVEKPQGGGQNNQQAIFLNLLFSDQSGQVVLHRQDNPSGQAATIIAPHDITTLNGVVHSVDNLMLP